DSCSLSENETISVFIKRTGSMLRIICRGQGCQSCETSDACRADRRLCSACHHYISVAVLDRTERIADAVRAGSTCCDNVGTFSFQSKLDGNISCSHIGDHQRNHQRVYLVRPLCEDLFVVRLNTLKASDTG